MNIYFDIVLRHIRHENRTKGFFYYWLEEKVIKMVLFISETKLVYSRLIKIIFSGAKKLGIVYNGDGHGSRIPLNKY